MLLLQLYYPLTKYNPFFYRCQILSLSLNVYLNRKNHPGFRQLWFLISRRKTDLIFNAGMISIVDLVFV